MIVASAIAMRSGAKPLFSDVSIDFGGELEPAAGTVALESN